MRLADQKGAEMTNYSAPGSTGFGGGRIRWREVEGLEHLALSILNVDRDRGQVDFLARFEANQPIILHRHLVQTNTFVVEGEHRIYEPDGSLKEIRAVGSFTASAPGGVHRECGGDETCVVLYNLGADSDDLFDRLDDNKNVIRKLKMADFLEILNLQRQSA